MKMLSDLGLLALRVAVGLVFLGHGAQKGFGSFGGPGFAGASGFFGSMGLRPARFWTGVAVGGELLAGALLLLGLLLPLAALIVVATMAVAVAKVHGPKGFFVQNGGYEYNLVLAIAALALAATGPGAYSLDHLLGLAR
jgi:putative oxidoreductase